MTTPTPAAGVEALARLDVAILHAAEARRLLLPLRLPVAAECCHLTRTLDGLRAVRRDHLAALAAREAAVTDQHPTTEEL